MSPPVHVPIPATRFVDLPGVRLACRLFAPDAAGLPVALIMGWTGVKEDWGNVPLLLAADRPVLVFDNRGMGESSIAEGNYTMEMMAKDGIALADRLGWTRHHLVGVSMGGMIAQTFAVTAPDRVEKLVLGCTHCGGGDFVPPSNKALEALGPDLDPTVRIPDPEAYVRSLMWLTYTEGWIGAHPDEAEARVRQVLAHRRSRRGTARQLHAIVNFNLEDRVTSIAQETLILHGTADNLIPFENAHRLASKIARARLHPIEGAGHAFWNMDAGESARAIREFLAR